MEVLPISLIIHKSKNGDAAMQKMLYQRYALPMYHVCLRYSKDSFHAEDMLQEGFIKVFKNLDQYRGEGSFEGWVRKIISRTALNYIRDNKINRLNTGLDNGIGDSECNAIDKLAEKDIMKLLTKLPPGYRTVFRLYVIEGYNHGEIAKILGCSESNCKSQFFHSKRFLKKCLDVEQVPL